MGASWDAPSSSLSKMDRDQAEIELKKTPGDNQTQQTNDTFFMRTKTSVEPLPFLTV